MLAGIAAAQDAGFENIRLNAIAIRSLTEDEIVPLARFARERGLELRFIEYMPLDAEQHWQAADVLDGDDDPPHRWRPNSARSCRSLRPTRASRQRISSTPTGAAASGSFSPVSQPFCGDCDRLRLTAEGQVRNCLFSTREWDARQLLREGGSDDEIADLVRDCVWAKAPAHGIGSDDFVRPERAMYQIGG